ncbi:MAG: XisH protein [Chloroflexi bacterium]|nr:XisH protein [Chloroflexota bacterium]MCC6895243.1 XisH protein [Anaerolineae bacterium]
MPVLDSCHQQVVNALRKASWNVTDKPVFLRADGLTIFADIQAQLVNGNIQQIIIVEVKCFADERSDQDELYRAVGQYMLYRSILQLKAPHLPLYLAVPNLVYERLFRKAIVQNMITGNGIKLIVIDIEREEIVQWIG